MSRLRQRLAARLGGDAARTRAWALVPGLVRTLAEAGWLTVLYAAIAVLADKQRPVLGPVEMYGFVGLGVVLRLAGRREPAIGAVLLIAGIALSGVAGSLAGPEPRALGGSWLHQVGAHFAGWLCGVAVLRGAMVSTTERAAEQLDQMLRVMPAAIGLVWAYTTFAGRPHLWLDFAVLAMWGTGMYLSGSIVGIGIARLNLLHADVRDLRQKRAWRGLVFAIGFGIVPIAIPVAVLAGVPLAAIVSPIVGPIQWLLTLLAYPLSWILYVAALILEPVANWMAITLAQFKFNMPQRLTAPELTGEAASRDIATILAALITMGTLLLIVFVIYSAAQWLIARREQPEDGDPTTSDVERAIVLPEAVRPPAPQRRRRRGAARDAVSAYVAALDELEKQPALARLPAETPAQHAARLRRSASEVWPDMARLAASYQLARYGARRISVLENTRALGRFQRIRRALRS